MRILALIPEAFGGFGGIALYNRHLLTALCEHPDCTEVVAIPRLKPNQCETIPEKLNYVIGGLNSKVKYILEVLKTVKRNATFDLLICGHINLVSLGHALKYWLKVPMLLEIYGIDAWEPTDHILRNYFVKHVDAFISISEFTKERFLTWAELVHSKGYLLPNAIQTDSYGPGLKNEILLSRYGLKDRTILMTLGRLVSRDRYKGFDIVLELLPKLIKEIPDIAYVIAGDGVDGDRLKKKTKDLGIEKHVVFTGHIKEVEKADHYRLADVYVMPSRGEGFGFVFLEAMACGIPVVASKADGSREAVLDGKLGILVDPDNLEEIKAGILEALERPRGIVPEGLGYFSLENFTRRLHSIVDEVVSETSR